MRFSIARTKSPKPTPVTLSLKVTVQLTVVALVGLDATRLTEDTVGAVVSTTMFLFPPSELAAPVAGSVRVADAGKFHFAGGGKLAINARMVAPKRPNADHGNTNFLLGRQSSVLGRQEKRL